MKRLLLGIAALALLAAPALAQTARVVTNCGAVAPFGAQPAGGLAYSTIDTNGNLCIGLAGGRNGSFKGGVSQVIGEVNVPIGLAPSGTIAANGALTLGTALDRTYPGLYFYLPAGAINAGSAANFYYATCSSATVCTVFNNVYTAGSASGPSIPASPTPFTGTTGVAYTQVLTQITAWSMNLPANSIGVNDGVRCSTLTINNNSAGTKTVTGRVGGSPFSSIAPTTTVNFAFLWGFRETGVTNNQIGMFVNGSGIGQNANPHPNFNADMTTPTPLSVTMQLAATTDWVMLVGNTCEYLPGV